MIPTYLLASDFYGLALELFVIPLMILVASVGILSAVKRWRVALVICGVLLLVLAVDLFFDYVHMRGASHFDGLTLACAVICTISAAAFIGLCFRRRVR